MMGPTMVPHYVHTATRSILMLFLVIGVCLLFAKWHTCLSNRAWSSSAVAGKGPIKTIWPNACDPLTRKLIDKYFIPHRGGIYEHHITDAFIHIPNSVLSNNEGSIVLFQVIKNVIYLDKSRLEHYMWDRMRFQNVFEALKSFIIERSLYCRSTYASVEECRACEQDFEFVADCQSAWKTRDPFTYSNKTAAESLQHYSQLPIFTITKCIDRPTIPVVQWYDDRDGKFLAYDNWRRGFLINSSTKAPDDRQKKAVFYGGFQPITTYTEDERPSQVINKDNWFKYSRTRLVYLGKQHPDKLEVGLQIEHRDLLGDEYHKINSDKKYPAVLQAQNFRYVVYAEGACGWADRLKILLQYNATILLQKTPCFEYYQEYLEPYVHYIPVKGNFDDLIEKIEWAQQNDRKAADIARNALALGQKYLTVAEMRCYMNLIFDRYSKLTRYAPSRRPGTEVEWDLKVELLG